VRVSADGKLRGGEDAGVVGWSQQAGSRRNHAVALRVSGLLTTRSTRLASLKTGTAGDALFMRFSSLLPPEAAPVLVLHPVPG